ncbi:PREDICTED: uncharacterized protein LOC109481108 [Branchiostoma belcheri]|uniref:Uncharacterized protein LOC109481108 n=1 Tax=Branchiostoma belcheri TaxID=7741 RepID=A0A6P5ABI2_BRABE|nr:PREDICTED: uncharacterized protein LOC109481108 [Branchiostoma belcheri]
MTPVTFSLEEDYDWLDVYMGDIDDATLLGSYTGQNIPEEVIVTYEIAQLVFSTDESNTDDGFKIHFEAFDLMDSQCPDPGVPDNGYRTGDDFAVGSVVSFGCNDGYVLFGQERLTCIWILVADPGKVVVTNFSQFDIEFESRCRYDYLRIQDMPYMNLQGFQRIHHLSGDTGTFSSMNYPHYPYRNHVYQQWNIIVDTRKAVKLIFLDFDVDFDPECSKDYVLAEDPFDQIHYTWCGTCVPPPQTSAAHILYVMLVTDFVIRRTGFSARYEAVDKGKTAGTHWQAVHIGLVTNFLFNFEKTPRGYNWIHEIDQIHSGKNVLWVIGTQDSYIYGDTIVRKVKYDWESIDGCKRSISVGRAGVWAVDSSGEVYHRAGTFLNETSRGEGWVRVPGVALQQVDVGDGIVWGVDFDNRVFAKLLPAPTDRATCQVGLKGHSACYATLQGFAACPEKRRRMCNGDVGCYSPIRVCDGERNCGADTEDERDCLDSCIFHAKRDEFLTRELVQCRDLKGCVKITNVCDGKKDCSDGSDEIRCDEVCESIGYWPCRSSLPPFPKCISRQERCDRHANCRDFSDEMDCGLARPCEGRWEWKCPGENTCLPDMFVCNTVLECSNGEDEKHCDGVLHDYLCSTGECSSSFFFCDDSTLFGCSNWEDEQGCGDFSLYICCPGITCEETHKCGGPLWIDCDGLPDCLDFTDETNCASTKCVDTQITSSDFKRISISQYCDGNDDCRTGIDENPRKCAMFTDRLSCISSNRFISRSSICDGIPDCVDASDEDACIGKGACLLPLSLLLEEYSIEEGTGTSHVIRSSHGLTPARWAVEGLDDWLQITLEDTVQLTGIVISGSRPSQTLTFSLEYGVWADCLTAYTEGDGVKIFQARSNGVEQAEHYLAVPVQARVVRLTPQSLMDTTILEVGLLGCLIKEHPEKGISCGKGWTMFEEHCYQKFASPLVWWAAERYCQALGGHLVAVNSLQENEFLRDNVGNGWIGMKLAASLIKEDRQSIVNFTWSDGSPAGEAFQEQGISFDVFQEYIWRLNDPFCAFLEKHGPWSLHPCSLIEKEYICEKDPSSYRSDGCDTTANYNYTDLQHGETDRNELNMYLPDMTVCDDCMASKPACGNIRCGSPDQYRCGLIYSPGYPTAFPSSVICLWIIDGPPGSFVTLLLLDVDLPGYSSGACTSRVLQVRDRFLTVDWNTIHGLCRGEGAQRRYVSSSNDMQLAMLATSNDADFGDSRGFMATFNISTFSASRQVQNLPDDAGLYDIYRDRTFVWTDGTPVTYMDWSPMDIRTGFPQPDGAKINFCVAIVMKNVWGTDQWYDVACDDRATRSYICKQAAKRVTGSGNN